MSTFYVNYVLRNCSWIEILFLFKIHGDQIVETANGTEFILRYIRVMLILRY